MSRLSRAFWSFMDALDRNREKRVRPLDERLPLPPDLAPEMPGDSVTPEEDE